MKHVFARCLVALLCLTMPLSALAEGYVWVISPQYDYTWEFSESLAAVRVGDWKTGKWGFIDKTGEVVVPPQYDSAGSFREGLAMVMIEDEETEKWGFIDNTGKEIVPPQYDDAGSFREGLAAVMVEGKWGFIDTTGKEIISPQYDNVYSFRNGLAMVMVGDADRPDVWDVFDDQKWGYIDKTGTEVVPIEYDRVGEFHEGRACVIKDGKLGFVDETGAVVIPLTYESPLPSLVAWYQDITPFFSEGLAAIWGGDAHGNQYGYIVKEGNVVIPFEYGYAAPFSEGLAYVSKGGALILDDADEDGKYGFINKTGEVVVPLVYDCDYWGWGIINEEFFHDGFATISKDTSEDMKYGMIDRTGTVVVPIQYDMTWRFINGLARVGFGCFNDCCIFWESCGLVDTTGREVVAIGRYHEIGSFHEGLARVWSGADKDGYGQREYGTGTHGFIDTTGKEVVPCIFEDAFSFSEGLAAVKVDGKWGYIAITE